MLCEIEVLQRKRLVCRGIEQSPRVNCLWREATVDADMSLNTDHAWTIELRLITIITRTKVIQQKVESRWQIQLLQVAA